MKFGPYEAVVRLNGQEIVCDPYAAEKASPFALKTYAQRQPYATQSLAYVLYALRTFTWEEIASQDVDARVYGPGHQRSASCFLGPIDSRPYLLSTVPGVVELPLGSTQFTLLRHMPLVESILRARLAIHNRPRVVKADLVDALAAESILRYGDDEDSAAELAQNTLGDAYQFITCDDEYAWLTPGRTANMYFSV